MNKTPTELGYETQDVRASTLVWAVVVLFAVIVLSMIAMTVMFGALYEARTDEINEVSPLANLREKPEGPILQVDPPKELIEMRARNAVAGTTYRWVKREAGVVRIPMERAMTLLVERGIDGNGK